MSSEIYIRRKFARSALRLSDHADSDTAQSYEKLGILLTFFSFNRTSPPPMPSSPSSLFEAYTRHLLLEQGLSANTREAYGRDVAKLLSYLADEQVELREVTLEHLHRFSFELCELGISPTSVARILSGVRSFFRFLVLDGFLDADPTELLESPHRPKHLPEVLTVEEVDRIEQAFDVSTGEGCRDRAMVEVLYSCGLRVSELCSLRLSDLFLEEGFLKVEGKGSKQRLVPISERAVKEIGQWMFHRHEITIRPGEEDYVFLSLRRGKHLSRITVFHNLRVAAEAAGITKNISPHTLRHTFATHLLEGGANLRAIQAMLGHERITTTEIHTHLDRSFLRAQVLEHFPRNKESD